MKSPRPLSLSEIFVIPLVLGAVSLAGLVSALLGGGLWDFLSWLAIGLPVAAVLWAILRRRC